MYFNEYSITTIDNIDVNPLSRGTFTFMWPRENRFEGLVFFKRYMWIYACLLFAMVTVIGSYVILFKAFEDEAFTRKRGFKSRVTAIIGSLVAFNFAYLSIDTSFFFHVVNIYHPNNTLAALDRIFAMIHCVFLIVSHFCFNLQFRKKFRKMIGLTHNKGVTDGVGQ